MPSCWVDQTYETLRIWVALWAQIETVFFSYPSISHLLFASYLLMHFCVSVSLYQTEQLLEFMHQLPAFANMTMSVRRDLCSVMVFEVVEQAGTVILHDKQEVWLESLVLSSELSQVMKEL